MSKRWGLSVVLTLGALAIGSHAESWWIDQHIQLGMYSLPAALAPCRDQFVNGLARPDQGRRNLFTHSNTQDRSSNAFTAALRQLQAGAACAAAEHLGNAFHYLQDAADPSKMVDDFVHDTRGQIVRDVMRDVLRQRRMEQTGARGLEGKDIGGIVGQVHGEARTNATNLVTVFHAFRNRPVTQSYPIFRVPVSEEEWNNRISPPPTPQQRPAYVLDAGLARDIANVLQRTVGRIVAAQGVYVRMLQTGTPPAPRPDQAAPPATDADRKMLSDQVMRARTAWAQHLCTPKPKTQSCNIVANNWADFMGQRVSQCRTKAHVAAFMTMLSCSNSRILAVQDERGIGLADAAVRQQCPAPFDGQVRSGGGTGFGRAQ